MVFHSHAHMSLCPLSPERRTLWLNIRGKEAVALSMFHVSMPLPGVSGGVTGPDSGCSLASAGGPGPWLSPTLPDFLMGLLVWLPT